MMIIFSVIQAMHLIIFNHVNVEVSGYFFCFSKNNNPLLRIILVFLELHFCLSKIPRLRSAHCGRKNIYVNHTHQNH